MFKVLVIFLLPHILVGGSTFYQRTRVNFLADSLNYPPTMPANWRISILDGPSFRTNTRKYDVDTDIAFTIIEQDATYLNEDYLITHPDPDVRWAIAHEAGHLICYCRNENTANKIAAQLEK